MIATRLPGLARRRQRRDPALLPALVDDEVLDRLDADRIVVDVERARRLAGRRADAAGELGKVVRRVQHVERRAPLLPVDEIVPVRNDVVDRAAGLAERDAAVHAARALLRRFVVLERQHELAVVPDALGDRQRDLLDARSSMKPVILPMSVAPAWRCSCARVAAGRPSAGRLLRVQLGQRAPVLVREDLDELAARGVPVVEDRERPRAAGEAQVALDQLAQRAARQRGRRAAAGPCRRRRAPSPPSPARPSASTGSSATIAVLQRVANVPSSS